MLSNYSKVAWRNMNRQKMYTLITIGGFGLGLATCILIFLYIRDEISYDKHYANGDLLYRIYNEYNEDQPQRWIALPASVASIVQKDYPDIEKAGRLVPYKWFNAGSNMVRKSDEVENIYEEGFAYADQSLLEILEIPMVYGNPSRALDKPNTLVISRKISEKYFGKENPVGQLLILNDDPSKTYSIGGVMENMPANSHLQYDFLLTLSQVEFWPGEQTSWCCWNYDTYVKLKPGTNVADLERKLLSMRDTYHLGYLKEVGDQSLDDVKKYQRYKLQSVGDIHLNAVGVGDIFPHGDAQYLWLFGGVACFILVLACINFINLSTARSANRAKEVGLRKVVGSLRSALIKQFLTESLFQSLLSFLIALLIVVLTLPYFNEVANKSLSLPWTEWWFVPVLVLSSLLVGLIAGLYPSFYLSAFKPIDVLKGRISRGSKNSRLRSAMVVFQFTTSIILIIGTIVIYRQMNFILTTKIGFDKEQVMMIQGANTLDKMQQAFKEELLQLKDVEHVTTSNYLPVSDSKRDQNGFWLEGRSKIDKPIGAQHWHVDEDYLQAMGIKLAEGRNFIPLMASDSQAAIINRSMAKALGLKNPVGEKIMNWTAFTVVGVVEDFHFESMKGSIGPLVLTRSNGGSIMSVKLNTTDMAGRIESIAAVWKKFMPHQALRYTFLDESYARMYDDVKRMGTLFATFSLLAIAVACLGLFALSAFMTEQRSKEISVRIVLGASVNSILRLLASNFVKMIFISFVIAAPMAWYMMNTWLEEYEYKTSISWDIFVTSGLMALSIAMLTISYQSLRAAHVNPATKLRSE